MRHVTLVIICILFLTGICFAQSYTITQTPAVLKFVEKVKNLQSPTSELPLPPNGCGIIRDDSSGRIILLLISNPYAKEVYVGNYARTKYGGQVSAIIQ